MDEKLVEIWQEHQCLFDVSSELYHNWVEKEKVSRENSGLAHVTCTCT